MRNTYEISIQSLLLTLLYLINAIPLLRTTFPPSTLVENLISSQPSFESPGLQASVISLSPGLTGATKRAWNSWVLAGSLSPED